MADRASERREVQSATAAREEGSNEAAERILERLQEIAGREQEVLVNADSDADARCPTPRPTIGGEGANN